MTWIAQRTNNDCGLATLAMLLGLTYEEVGVAIPEYGLTDWQIVDEMGKRGYAQIISPNPRTWDAFAPLHYLAVRCREDGPMHSVAMNADGRIYDPGREWVRGPESFCYLWANIGFRASTGEGAK